MKNQADYAGRERPRRLTLLVALAAAQAAMTHGVAQAAPGASLGSMLLSEAALDRAVQRGDLPGRLLPAAAPGASPQIDPQTGKPYVSDPGPQPKSAPQSDYVDRPYKGYGAAALEILGFQAALNRFDNAFEGPDYHINMGTLRRNLHSSWVEDQDPFRINQLGHPYQGSIYYNIARSNGLSFWESMGYSLAGSTVWEIAGENTAPSRNDEITTSFGGAFLGEALYRMANLVLEQGYGLPPGWREGVAAGISPALGFNRYLRPGKGSGLFASNNPALYSRLQLGVSVPTANTAGPSAAEKESEYGADFLLDYGLPGKPGYEYHRPFDYFRFQLRATNVQGVEQLATRGLLFGAPYAAGRDLRGVAGIYGSYDYLSPQLFRVASTAVSIGSNAQWRVADNVVLQGHASTGVGYTSTGTIQARSDHQWHYGWAPQAMLSLRLVLGDKLLFDTTAQQFFNGKLTSNAPGGNDRVFRADASLTYRMRRNHAIALKYITSRRDFTFPNVIDVSQRRDSIGLYYVYQEAKGFGVVSW
jgi:hypothetical protein